MVALACDLDLPHQKVVLACNLDLPHHEVVLACDLDLPHQKVVLAFDLDLLSVQNVVLACDLDLLSAYDLEILPHQKMVLAFDLEPLRHTAVALEEDGLGVACVENLQVVFEVLSSLGKLVVCIRDLCQGQAREQDETWKPCLPAFFGTPPLSSDCAYGQTGSLYPCG
jgi:hypothetical protein